MAVSKVVKITRKLETQLKVLHEHSKSLKNNRKKIYTRINAANRPVTYLEASKLSDIEDNISTTSNAIDSLESTIYYLEQLYS